jgi:protein-S-isoprenylcysteine O-methyltransferase Ste14
MHDNDARGVAVDLSGPDQMKLARCAAQFGQVSASVGMRERARRTALAARSLLRPRRDPDGLALGAERRAIQGGLEVDVPDWRHGRDRQTRLFDIVRDVAREGFVRLSILLLYVPLMSQVLSDAVATRRIAGLLFLCNASVIVVFTLMRRTSETVDRSWPARAVTLAAVMGPLLFRPGAVGPVSDHVAGTIGCAGLAISIGGTLALRRSFGLMPANRGIVNAGLYRIVRHPIYAGYLASHVAFVLTYPTLWNALIWTLSDGAQFVRVRYEERLLQRDSSYAGYIQAVRWRVLPGVF